MKLFLLTLIFILPSESLLASHIFHMEQKKGACLWMLYNVETAKDKKYFQTPSCPNQIVWLKDKSFYYSINSQIYWSHKWTKNPIKVVNYMSARKGHSASSEVIWGVKGKYNSIHTLVIDPDIKHIKANGKDIFEYKHKAVDLNTFKGDESEHKAAGIIKRWQKGTKKWKKEDIKLVGRYNNTNYDEDLYNNSVLSSRQIISYNECADNDCEKLPRKSFWDFSSWEDQVKMIDDGLESMAYLPLDDEKGILFKKSLAGTLHPVQPFILCENNCKKMTEVELPKSFSDKYAMVKKGHHYLVTNEDRGSIGNLYTFNSAKPIKKFRGPMVFWHPF